MVRKACALVGLAALLTLSACTPGEPAVPVNDRVAAANRTAEPAAGGEGEGGEGQAPEGPVVQWAGGAGIEYTQVPDSLPVGPQTFELTCESLPHNVVLEELGDQLVVECEGEGTEVGTTDVPAGEYTYYCSIAGHREAGMEGTIVAE